MQPPKPMKPQGGPLKSTDPNLAHETTDISLTGVVAFIVALAFCGLVIFVVLWGVFHFAAGYAAKQDELDKRDPWVQRSEDQVEQAAKKLRTPENKAKEPASMEMADSESRVRVSRFPQPRLQDDDVHDLAVMREAEDIYLNEYFVLDKNSGKVNIPITQAMQAIVQKGLPAMQPAPGAAMPGTAEGTGVTKPSIQSSHQKQQTGGIQ
jgi:hypothetical protein